MARVSDEYGTLFLAAVIAWAVISTLLTASSKWALQTPHAGRRGCAASLYSRALCDRTSVYYINLASATERRRDIEKHLSLRGVCAARFEAIDGHAVDLDRVELDPSLRDHFRVRPDRRGHLGCMLSHLGALTAFLEGGSANLCLIMEDDCWISVEDFWGAVHTALPEHGEWDMLLCGYHIDEQFHPWHRERNGRFEPRDGLAPVVQFVGLHCYLVSRRGARAIVDLVVRPSWYLDWELSELAHRNLLTIYGIFPPIACQPAVHRILVNDTHYEYDCGGWVYDSSTTADNTPS